LTDPTSLEEAPQCFGQGLTLKAQFASRRRSLLLGGVFRVLFLRRVFFEGVFHSAGGVPGMTWE
jgi:hypothetical protein